MNKKSILNFSTVDDSQESCCQVSGETLSEPEKANVSSQAAKKYEQLSNVARTNDEQMITDVRQDKNCEIAKGTVSVSNFGSFDIWASVKCVCPKCGHMEQWSDYVPYPQSLPTTGLHPWSCSWCGWKGMAQWEEV